jgi:tetratricopeptide (TPR) repeat protein
MSAMSDERPIQTDVLRDHAFMLHERGDLEGAEGAYREVLDRTPQDLEVRHALGILSVQSGRYAAAVDLLRPVALAIKAGPVHADLGNAYTGLSRFEDAVRHYDQAIELDPGAAAALYNRGNALRALARRTEALASHQRAIEAWPEFFEPRLAAGELLIDLERPLEASAAYQGAAALRPSDGRAHLGLGIAYIQLQRWLEASTAVERAMQLGGNSAQAHTAMGACRAALGHHEEALRSYEQAILLQPGYLSAQVNRGISLRALGRPADALACYDRALGVVPDHREALANRGLILADLDRLEEALHDCNRAIALHPRQAELHANRAAVLVKVGRLEEAVEGYDQAIALRPGFAQAYASRAGILLRLEAPDQALAAADQALALEPKLADAHYARGLALRELDRPHEALVDMTAAMERKPDDAHIRFNLGCLELLLGDFAEGWELYEWRNRARGVPDCRRFDEPQWAGEDIDGKTLFVYADRGIGDTFQFVRYVPLLRARGASVVLSVQNGLRRLLKELGSIAEIIDETERPAKLDFHCPLASLPRAFRTTLATIPTPGGYLTAEREKVATWREKLRMEDLKIGVCWQGRSPDDKSFPLKNLEGIAALPGVRLISLQKVDGLDQLRDLPAGMSVETLGEYTFDPEPFVDTAAVMQLLDLVITCDTSVAHLAGALGRPAWVALKQVPDWRWLRERSDNPWYSSLRSFRQTRRGDWYGVFDRMRDALAAQITSRPEFRA